MKFMAIIEMVKHLLNKWTFLFLAAGLGLIDNPFQYKKVILVSLAIFCGKMSQEAETEVLSWFSKPKKKPKRK